MLLDGEDLMQDSMQDDGAIEPVPKKRTGRPPGVKNKNGYHYKSPETREAALEKRRKGNLTTRRGFGEKEEDKELIARLMQETLYSYRYPRVRNDEELAQRIDEYFRECAESGLIPTVEEMVMRTGMPYSTYKDIRTGRRPGFSPRTKEVMKRAQDFMATFDAKLALTGQGNPIVYFFRAKNFYGMRDQQNVVVEANDNEEQELSAEDIARRYIDDGKIIEQSFPEDSQKGE